LTPEKPTMAENSPRDTAFDIGFFEAVLRHDRQCVEVIEILGGLYTKLGRIADGLKMDRKLVRLQPSNATAHYNLACSLALSKRNAEALRSLRDAVALGYRDFEWMSHDPDLQGLKRNAEFRALVAQLKLQT
jgi:tetratricopeptide (TPR) repeat protein